MPAPSTSFAARDRRWGLVALVLALGPSLAAVGWVRWFVTQDGPAHLYNARILADSGRAESPLHEAFQVRWQPLPNWAGHLALLGLIEAFSPAMANRLITGATLIGLALAAVWLRWTVQGWAGMSLAAPLAAMLALNVAWLLGFTSFLLGACLFAITLGVWWSGREHPGPTLATSLGGLVVLGYACHPVSLGLTVVGLFVLALTTPTQGDGKRRLAWTAIGLTPLVPLGLYYRRVMSQNGGGLAPSWGHLADPFTVTSWWSQAGWVDPVSVASKVVLPFVAGTHPARAILAPVLWLSAALLIWTSAGLKANLAADRRGWWLLAALLIVGGIACPDTLGASHGNYLPQRVVLLGLIALVPALDLDPRRRSTRLGATALGVALAVQSAFVWQYALHADRIARVFERAGPAVGQGQRVATLLVGIRGRFRPNPLLHADNLLGIAGRNILWSNYEARHYYFPVQFRTDIKHPNPAEFEAIALLDDPRDADQRRIRWRDLLARDPDAIDVVVTWNSGQSPEVATPGFTPFYQDGPLRVLRRP